MNNTDIDITHPELIDKWIDAIPENNYDICPCGCNRKFKFVKNEIEKHEERFKLRELLKTYSAK